MKKLFGVMCLFFCVLLASCNMGLFSDRSGSIDFSIPTKDIIDAANNYAARGVDNDQTWNYAFLVQIKGNRGYYDYQLQTLTVETHEDFGNLNPGQINGLYVKNNNVNFSFNNVPAGQKYKIMFDAFVFYAYPGQEGTYYKTFSGNTENIKVKPGKPAEVGITAKAPDKSMFNLVVVTENNGTFTIPAESAMNMIFGSTPPNYSSPRFSEENGALIFRESEVDKNDKKVIDVYLALVPNSNIDTSSFNISFLYGDSANPSRYNLKFNNNICSIKNFIIQGIKFPADKIKNDETLEMTLPGLIQISKNGFSYQEPASSFYFRSYDEYLSGSNSMTLTFEKKTYDGGQVLLYVEPVNDLLNVSFGGTDFDTAVLVLKTRGSNLVSTGTQLYYKLEEDQSGSLPFNYGQEDDEISGSTLFYNNKCINHKTGENKFVLPFNKVDYPNGAWYLVLFVPYEGDSETVDISVDIDYCVFPTNLNVHVFGVGQAYDNQGNPTGGYRYETDILVNTSLTGSYKYKAMLNGYVCGLHLSDGYFSQKTVTLTGELYNSDSEHDFYPLSNGNIPVVQTYSGSNEDDNEFIFTNIRDPLMNASTYFQCISPCEDTNTLLIVRDLDWDITPWNN